MTRPAIQLLNDVFRIMQLKSLATLGVEGYAVLLNVDNSHCRLLYGSDVAQDYVDTVEEKGQALDDMFFKYMCGT